MVAVQTATGPVADGELGWTLSHEHVWIASPGMPQQYPWLYDRPAAVELAVTELGAAREAGIGTIIDLTAPDLGRDAPFLAEVSERSGVRIVVASGIWLDIPRWFHDATIDEITELFVREIEVGIADTGIRAGVMKVANGRSPGIGEQQGKILRAAARAAVRTAVPISTHTSPYDIGREQMRIFAEERVPPRLVCIGHAFTDDLDYLHEVLDAGHYLSIDHFRAGRDGEHAVVQAIAHLCAEGHAEQLMLSHDNVVSADGRLQREPAGGYTHVPIGVRTALGELGVDDATFDTMLRTAPAAFLAGGRTA